MKELTEDKIYKMLVEEYDELLLDYVVLSFEEEYLGAQSHKKAVIAAIEALNSRGRVGNHYEHQPFFVNESEMCGEEYPTEYFFSENRHVSAPENVFRYMTYREAFFDPPYGVPYSADDFHKINDTLFPPQSRDELEIYCWNDGFSNYFDDGKDWWGTALWSVYDRAMKRFVIVGASLSD